MSALQADEALQPKKPERALLKPENLRIKKDTQLGVRQSGNVVDSLAWDRLRLGHRPFEDRSGLCGPESVFKLQ